ncbi:MAG: ATP-dependent metallopeptidase FtsH/Yme1/Tma family protein, partial [bacterium]
MTHSPTDNAAPPPSTGRRQTSSEAASVPPRLRPQNWWLIFLLLVVANYAVTQVFFREPPSIAIPYSIFTQQVGAGNVADVTSVGDAIQGTFKTTVTYPPPTSPAQAANAPAPAPPSPGQPKARTSMQFTTQRPTFAGQDLEKRLEENGVVIKAIDENASSWIKLLVGFGPTVLLIAAFVWLSGRAAAAA